MTNDDQIVEQVRAASDIAEVVGQYVPLKRSGRNLKANCPFHQEKTPSFMVQPEKQIFHCFGCGVGGDVFSFLMRYENMSFPEALRSLAERAHIELPKFSSKKSEGSSENEQLYEIYRLAADYYHAQFSHPERGRAARQYFEQRGFAPSLAEEFKIGWAPEEWHGLFDFLSKKGFSNAVLIRSGLVHQSPKGSLYDSFRGRILFPIRNLQGKVVAFGGRLLGEGEGPKYLNSPENPIFQKRRELFGLYLAKKFVDRDRPRLIVVEGYFDFLGLYQDRFKAAVATLGTALSDHHVQLLKRFADEAIVVYDGDKAGESAALRGLEIFLEGGMSVKLARLPEGFDPDDFIRKKGADAFQKILDDARDFFDYKLEILLGRYQRSDTLGLIKITNEFLETFVKVKNPILIDRYLKRLAASLGIEENSLRGELAKLKKKAEASGPFNAKQAAKAVTLKKPEIQDEILLLSLLIEGESLRKAALSVLSETDFSDPPARETFLLLKEWEGTQAKEGPAGWTYLLHRLHDESFKQKLVAASALEWTEEDRAKALEDCLRRIKRKQVERKLAGLRQDIARAEHDGDRAGLGVYIKEYQELWRQMR